MSVFSRSFFNVQTKNNEVIASIYERIIDEIGLENIVMLVPAWEETGDEIACIIDPSIKFKASTPPAVMDYSGLLHPTPRFENANSGFEQMAKTESLDSSSSVNLGVSDKLAQKTELITLSVGLASLKLKRTGTLASATLKISIYTGASEPTDLVAESDTIPASSVGTSSDFKGFVFSSTPEIKAGGSTWVVLEYVDSTGVDGSNYISWDYDGGSDTYGRDRATFNGSSWTVVADENHSFKLYDDTFLTPDEFTIITAARYNYSVFSSSFGRHLEVIHPSYNHFYVSSNDYVSAQAGLSGVFAFIGDNIHRPLSFWNNNNVYASQFSKSKSEGKFQAFLNGRKVISGNGTSGDGYPHADRPIQIGKNWVGGIGPIIMTKNFLTEGTIARVANLLMTIRRLNR